MPSTAPIDPAVPVQYQQALQTFVAALPAERRAAAQLRTEGCAGLLFQRLHALYGHRTDFGAHWSALLQRMGDKLAERSPGLYASGLQRDGQPDWFLSQTMLGYCAYADRFGGTLHDLVERIPHLQRLGIRYLHLLPFLKARDGDNDGGFAVADFDAVEPSLGTMEDLTALCEALADAGIVLCSDFVLNHVADDHGWAAGARAGDAALRDFFRVYPDRALPDQFERTLRQVFPTAAPGNFTWDADLQGWVWTTFYPYQWDLNYENPAVFVEMACALLQLANRGISVFRLDSVGFLWKRLGGEGLNEIETHWIVQALRAVVDMAAPGVLLKAEAIVPTRELPPYFGLPDAPGRECQIAYHSSLMAATWGALAEQDAGLLKAVLRETPPLPQFCSWLTYVRCHDDIGWRVLEPTLEADGQDPMPVLQRIAHFYDGGDDSFADGAAFQTSADNAVHGTNGMTASLLGLVPETDPASHHHAFLRLALVYGLAYTVGGIPLLYMGDELAQGNDRSPASLARQVVDGRWLQRPVFDAHRAVAAGSGHGPAAPVLALFQRLAALRAALPGLAADQPLQVLSSPCKTLLAFTRSDSLLVLSNWSDQHIVLDALTLPEVQGETFETVYSSGHPWPASLTWPPAGGTLHAWQMVWLRRSNAASRF